VLANPKLGDWLCANGVSITRLALTQADPGVPVLARAIPA